MQRARTHTHLQQCRAHALTARSKTTAPVFAAENSRVWRLTVGACAVAELLYNDSDGMYYYSKINKIQASDWPKSYGKSTVSRLDFSVLNRGLL